MYAFLLVIHVIVSLSLVLVVLMQSSKGGGLAGAFGGGGGTSAIFGGRGAASFLQKLTTALAVGFIIISIVINLVSKPSDSSRSLIQEAAQEQAGKSGGVLPAPAVPISDAASDTAQ